MKLAIVGATGLVGEALLEQLSASDLSVDELFLLASENTAGSRVAFRHQSIMVGLLEGFDFSQADIVVFATPDSVVEKYAPLAEAAGCWVVDNSGAYADDPKALIVASAVDLNTSNNEGRLLVNPNSAAAQMAAFLRPVYEAFGLHSIYATIHQPAASCGRAAVTQLATQTASLMNGLGVNEQGGGLDQQLAFNLLPEQGAILENGWLKSEIAIHKQLLDLLGNSQAYCNINCVLAPVFYTESIALAFETIEPIIPEKLFELIKNNKEINLLEVFEGGSNGGVPASPATTATGKTDIFASRLRLSPHHMRCSNVWLMADVVQKSCAKNLLLIVEQLKKTFL